MDFEDLVTALLPPPNRIGKSNGEHEHHLYEGTVMLAYAMHLLQTLDAHHVHIHPDGEHGKQFDFCWLVDGITVPRPPDRSGSIYGKHITSRTKAGATLRVGWYRNRACGESWRS